MKQMMKWMLAKMDSFQEKIKANKERWMPLGEKRPGPA
jgi:hypothetical protein